MIIIVQITAELKSRMMYSGNLMVGYQPLDEKPNFFRYRGIHEKASGDVVSAVCVQRDR